MNARRLIPALLVSAVTMLLPGAGHAAAAARAVPFIADDYTKAVAEAKARKVPLFIESWAPW
jgi:hypothetical protein